MPPRLGYLFLKQLNSLDSTFESRFGFKVCCFRRVEPSALAEHRERWFVEFAFDIAWQFLSSAEAIDLIDKWLYKRLVSICCCYWWARSPPLVLRLWRSLSRITERSSSFSFFNCLSCCIIVTNLSSGNEASSSLLSFELFLWQLVVSRRSWLKLLPWRALLESKVFYGRQLKLLYYYWC